MDGYCNNILVDTELNEYLSKLKRKIYDKEKYISEMRLLKAKRDASVLYLSYSDGMARYHLSVINKSDAPSKMLS